MNTFQPWQLLLVPLSSWVSRHQLDVITYIQDEYRILKSKLKGKRICFSDDERRRLAVKGKALGSRVLREVASIVTPNTILVWHRKLIAKKYDGSSKRGPGRPRVADLIPKLTVRMAQENPSWGYTTISGVLFNLGHTTSRETIRNIHKVHGIVPAQEWRAWIPWSTFFKSHWGSMAAADFFTVVAWSCFGLTRYHVFICMDLSSRRIHIAGISESLYGAWMKQIGRNLTDPIDGFLAGMRYIILDRGPLYTGDFRELQRQAGVKTIRLPARSPNLNAYAERFVRTIKESCLNRMIFFGEKSPRKAFSEFVVHYHHKRNHQGLCNPQIAP